ncbi:MAG: M20 family metallopeptidase [Candidatus Nanohaloarchaea archaeon]
MSNYTGLNTKEILEKLVRFRSTSYNENDIAQWCVEYLRKNDRSPEIENYDPGKFLEDYDEGKTKNIYLDLGEGDEALLLYSHLDVVNADEELFEPKERDGRIYGRGTTDMKTSLAAQLYVAANYNFDKRVIFHFIADEETSGTGARVAVDKLKNKDLERLDCLLMEPTDNFGFIERESKGYAFCRVKGEFEEIWNLTKELKQIEISGSDEKLGENLITPTKIVPIDKPPEMDFSEIKGEDNHASRPEGGTNSIYKLIEKVKEVEFAYNPDNSRNTIPARTLYLEGEPSNQFCTLYIDVRTLPGYHSKIISKVKSLAENLELQIDDIGSPYETNPNSRLVNACLRASPEADLKGSKGASDAGYYSEVADTVVGGFGPGKVGVMHSEDEHVEVREIDRSVKIIKKVIDYY